MTQKVRTLANYFASILDILILFAAYCTANFLRFHQIYIEKITSADYMSFLWFLMIAYVVVQLFFRTNIDFLIRGRMRELYLVIKQYVLLAACAMAYFYLTKVGHDFSRLQFGFFIVLAPVLTYIEHLVLKFLLRRRYEYNAAERVIIITEKKHIGDIVKEFHSPELFYLKVEYIALLDGTKEDLFYDGIPVISGKEGLEDRLKDIAADAAFIYMTEEERDFVNELMGWLSAMGIKIYLHTRECEYDYGKKGFLSIGKYDTLIYSNYEYPIRDVVLKRMMDILAGLLLFLAMCICFPFVALAILIQSPGPIFFKQVRIGKNGRRFHIYKFRSMYMDAEERKKELMEQNEMGSDFMFKLKDDPRIFPAGKIIRKLSIDELPQAINILKGDMSLVGTRPPTEAEFELYEAYHRRRISIKPGLTGMWQVSGRSNITDFDQIVKLDCQYIDNWNLRVDMKIILKTVWVVLFGRGAE